MKKRIQKILQRSLGFRNYLFLFSRFKIRTLKWDNNEKDFFFFLEQLPKDARVLDIGANIGIMTWHLSKRCSKGKVHAVEPIAENIETLKRVIRRFRLSNVSLHPIALGEQAGALTMVMPEMKDVRMQGLSHVVAPEEKDQYKGTFYEVPVQRLDDTDFSQQKIHAIKIDVENFEYSVFKGGIEMLRRDRPLIYCELWDNENREQVFQLLGSELGYRIQVLVNGKLELFDPQKHKGQNFFFS